MSLVSCFASQASAFTLYPLPFALTFTLYPFSLFPYSPFETYEPTVRRSCHEIESGSGALPQSLGALDSGRHYSRIEHGLH